MRPPQGSAWMRDWPFFSAWMRDWKKNNAWMRDLRLPYVMRDFDKFLCVMRDFNKFLCVIAWFVHFLFGFANSWIIVLCLSRNKVEVEARMFVETSPEVTIRKGCFGVDGCKPFSVHNDAHDVWRSWFSWFVLCCFFATQSWQLRTF